MRPSSGMWGASSGPTRPWWTAATATPWTISPRPPRWRRRAGILRAAGFLSTASAFSAPRSGRCSTPCWSRGRRCAFPSAPTASPRGRGRTSSPARKRRPRACYATPGSILFPWRRRSAWRRTAAPPCRCWARWRSWPGAGRRTAARGRGSGSCRPGTGMRKPVSPLPKCPGWCGRRAGGTGTWPWSAGTWRTTGRRYPAPLPPTACRYSWSGRTPPFPGRW